MNERQTTINYLQSTVLGEGCTILEDGTVEQWTDGHGSGLTKHLGPATEKQRLASALIQILKDEDREEERVKRAREVNQFATRLSKEEKKRVLEILSLPR